MVKVRHRLTEEESRDVDIVQEIDDSKKVAREGPASEASKKKMEPFRGEFS
jgi:hypothetical protein